MKRKHSYHHLPHPGPDPARTLTLREILEEAGDGTMLLASQGRLPPRPVPRTRAQLAEDLAEILVHTEVFRRTLWNLAPELRDFFWRLLEPLYREGGVVAHKDLTHPPTSAQLHELEVAGLLFSLPSSARPKTLALPYEYFFMPDMPGTGPQSLCQGLRHYSDAGTRVLAGELGLREALPRAAALARLHRRLIEAGPRLVAHLAPAALSLLETVARRGGVIAARALSERLAATRPDWALRLPLSADDLLGARFNPNSPAQLLARRALLVPCGEPGWSAFPQVAIPEELREAAAGPLLAKSAAELAAARRALGVRLVAAPDARPGAFAADLARLALVARVEGLRATRSGAVGKAGRKRLGHVLHVSEAELEELLGFAQRCGGGAGLEGLEAFLAGGAAEQARALAEDFLGPAGWRRDFRRLLVSVLSDLGETWAPADALGRVLARDPAALAAYEAAHAGEHGPAEDVWVRTHALADLRSLHRLGFAERASGAPQESYRLAKTSAWALLARKPPAAALRAPRTAPAPEPGIAVLPTLEILAPPAGGAELLSEIARFSRLERADAAFVFRLDKSSVAAGVNSGLTADAIREFLERHSRNPLPGTVRTLLADAAGGAARVTWETEGSLLHAEDPMTLLRLRRVKWLRPWIAEGGPEGTVRLHPEADGEGLVKRLSREGFVVARRR
jgi:hypothetical protein